MTVNVMSILAGILGMLAVAFLYQITRADRVDLSGKGDSQRKYKYSSSRFGKAYTGGLNKILSESLVVKFAKLIGFNLELVQERIEALGIENSISSIEVVIIKILGIVSLAGGIMGFLLTSNLYVLIGLMSLGAALFFVPEARLKEMMQEQKSDIEAQLPQFIEQTYLCIAAGSTLQDALKYVAENTEGVLGKKVSAVFVNSMYGAKWSDELIRAAIELKIDAFEDFVNDIVIADSTGVNIEDTLKEEVNHINRINKARVMGEIKALQSKLSPLQIVFCMLPMMGIIMMPIVIQIMETL